MADMGLALSKGPENNEPLAALNRLHDALCDDMTFEWYNKAYKAILNVRAEENCDDQDRAEFGSPKDGYDKAIMELDWYLRTKMEELDKSCSDISKEFTSYTPPTVVEEAKAYINLGLDAELNLLLTRYGVKSIEELYLAEEAERQAQCRSELDKKMCGEDYDSDLADEAARLLF